MGNIKFKQIYFQRLCSYFKWGDTFINLRKIFQTAFLCKQKYTNWLKKKTIAESYESFIYWIEVCMDFEDWSSCYKCFDGLSNMTLVGMPAALQ